MDQNYSASHQPPPLVRGDIKGMGVQDSASSRWTPIGDCKGLHLPCQRPGFIRHRTGDSGRWRNGYVGLRSCFEMVHENNYRLFFSRFFDDLMAQWGSIATEKHRKICEKEA